MQARILEDVVDHRVHELGADGRHQDVAAGFAHGFLVISESAEFLYKTTDYWHPEDERSIRWDDPEIGIEWPAVGGVPIVSKKDARASFLANAAVFP